MRQPFSTEEIEDALEDIVADDLPNFNLINWPVEVSRFQVGFPESWQEIEEVSHVSCLGSNNEEDYQKMLEEGIIYTLISSRASHRSFDGYLRSYILELEEETTYGIATFQYDSLIGEEDKQAALLGLGANFLEASNRGVDKFAVACRIPYISLNNRRYEKVELDVETRDEGAIGFRSQPVKPSYGLGEERIILEEF